MTKEKLQKLVDDDVALQREVAGNTEVFKALKAALVEEAEMHTETQIATDRGGRRWTAPQVRRLRFLRGWSQSGPASKLQLAGLDIARSASRKSKRLWSSVRQHRQPNQ